MDRLLMEFRKYSKFDGEELTSDLFLDDSFWKKLFFRNAKEVQFYFETLKEEGLIDFRIQPAFGILPSYSNMKLTRQGLQYVIDLNQKTPQSKDCFVAMKFGDSTKDLRPVLTEVVEKAGFNKPIFMDEEVVDTIVTVNDRMLLDIKRARFLIADFSGQSKGVYFEAGYALGLGKPVIYICPKDEIKNAHFDTQAYQHIVYENYEVMKEKLRLWIGVIVS